MIWRDSPLWRRHRNAIRPESTRSLSSHSHQHPHHSYLRHHCFIITEQGMPQQGQHPTSFRAPNPPAPSKLAPAHRRVRRHELGHLPRQLVRGRRVAASCGEGHRPHGDGERPRREVGEDAVERVLDVRQVPLHATTRDGVKQTHGRQGATLAPVGHGSMPGDSSFVESGQAGAIPPRRGGGGGEAILALQEQRSSGAVAPDSSNQAETDPRRVWRGGICPGTLARDGLALQALPPAKVPRIISCTPAP